MQKREKTLHRTRVNFGQLHACNIKKLSEKDSLSSIVPEKGIRRIKGGK